MRRGSEKYGYVKDVGHQRLHGIRSITRENMGIMDILSEVDNSLARYNMEIVIVKDEADELLFKVATRPP